MKGLWVTTCSEAKQITLESKHVIAVIDRLEQQMMKKYSHFLVPLNVFVRIRKIYATLF